MRKEVFDLAGKTIYVSGSSSGIGRSVAIECSMRNATVILGGRNQARLEETLALLKDDAKHLVIKSDLSRDDELDALINNLPRLDGLVLNAGITKNMPIRFANKEWIDGIFKVNFFSTVRLIQGLLKARKIQRNSSVCFISSIASQHPTIGNSIYSASKGAVNSFVKGLALELASKPIRVNAILPGLVETDILRDSQVTEDDLKKHLDNYPIGRFGRPEEIAYLIIYLMSDASSWMTGSLLTIDGGFSIK